MNKHNRLFVFAIMQISNPDIQHTNIHNQRTTNDHKGYNVSLCLANRNEYCSYASIYGVLV